AKSMGPGGSAIEFRLLFDESSVQYIDQAAEECKAFLANKVGLSDFEDDSNEGKSELTVRLNEVGKALGLSESMLANSMRAGFYGEEVKREQRGRHEVKLMVRYPAEAREDMEEFEKIRIQDNDGIERPLLDVATPILEPSPSKINRLNQRRSVTISAEVDREKANAAQIIEEMKTGFIPDLIEKYRNEYDAKLSVSWEGEAAQNIESVDSMRNGFIVAMLAMYVLLTLQFRSYLQPLIILAIIPFGVLGAILGHAIMQIDLTLFSFFGLIALTGVVVNDSIVLVDCINRELRRGLPMTDALLSAGRRRFRPIMLTSFTTVAGLSPMLFETSLQAQVLIPMAVSLVFGLITGTLLILLLVPIFYFFYGTLLSWFGIPLYPDDSEIEAMNAEDATKKPPADSQLAH
ncbi:efflux RND transporter permease subunit, partial [Mariniblastus sp.]|nr:efflux RND transporter permease subunit [Mariniblastus sp.]